MKQILLITISIAASAIAVGCQQATTSPTTEGITSSRPVTETPATTSPISSPIAKVETTNSSFDESIYAFANPEVAELIKTGKYKSGLEHYTKVGQSTKKPDGESYESFFSGTSGSDTIAAFGKGKHVHLVGIKFEVLPKPGIKIPLRPQSIGKGESDILIGTKEGANEFVIGSFISELSPKAEAFYVGKGDEDRAQIKNFTKSKDSIMLAGTPDQYKFEPVAGNLRISTKTGDLVAIVEGVDKLTPSDISKDMGIFMLK
jgi:hypothetical protein